MTVIAQRVLRNQISSVLRRAEHGETFTITVNGRAVAELRPLARAVRQQEGLDAILARTPVDDRWTDDLRALRDEDASAAAGDG